MRTDAEIEAALRAQHDGDWPGKRSPTRIAEDKNRMHLAIAAADALAQDAYDPEDRAARSSDGDMALHLMTLDNFLGGQGGVSGAADAREALEQITDYLAEAGSVAPSSVPAERFEMRRVAGENAEIARLRRDCGEMYQVIGVLANGRPVLKVLNNALAAANGQPRPHDDLLPFTLPAPPAPSTPADETNAAVNAERNRRRWPDMACWRVCASPMAIRIGFEHWLWFPQRAACR